jgi:polygalacturonase
MPFSRRVALVLSLLPVALTTGNAHASVMAGSAPDPDDVDLALWLKADSLELQDGAAVAVWPDARDNGRVARAGPNAPVYSSDRLNGLPGVRFDSVSGGSRSLAVDDAVRLSREHTLIVVGQSRGTRDSFVSGCDRAGCVSLEARNLGSQRSLQVRYPQLDPADPASSAVSSRLAGPTVLAQVRASEKYVRGYVAEVTPPLIRVSSQTGAVETRASVLRIGGTDDPASALTGDVFEVLVYERALGVNELRAVFEYLNAKWFPAPAAKARVVWQSASPSSKAAPTTLAPFSPGHAPDAWYRDRGRGGFDLLDGSLDFFVRFDKPSRRWSSRDPALLQLDGGANGMSLSIRATGSRALEARLAAKDGADAETWSLLAAAKGFDVAANSLYHVVLTLATNPADGRVTAKLFAAPQNTPLDVSQPTFEIAGATAPPIDDPNVDPAARACAPSTGGVSNNLTDHAFGAWEPIRGRGLARVARLERLRVWRGVPKVFDSVATYPDVESIVAPRPEPAYPAGFDPFAPPIAAAAPARGTPELAEWTRSGVAGDSLALTGERLTAFSGDDEGKDTHFAVFGQSTESSNLSLAAVSRVERRRGVIGLDDALPASSMYLIWPANQNGFGRPVAVNRTEAWWLGPDRATRGDVVHVYGRNLSHDQGTSAAWLYLKPVGPKPGRWLAAMSVNPYRVGFSVPNDLTNGTYELWSHNGHGGRYGWSEPLSLTIDDGTVWDGATVDVSANGSDALPDDAEIQTALREAEQSARSTGRNATVRFAAGRFLLTQTLRLPSNVRIVGAGKGKTVLIGTSKLAPNSHLLLFDQTHDIEIADLTLDFGPAVLTAPVAFVMNGFVENLRVRNVRLIALHDPNQQLMWLIAKRAQFTGVDFFGPLTAVAGSAQVEFDRCNFYLTSGGITLFAVGGIRELSVTRCTAQDYNLGDDTTGAGWSQGRFVNIVNRAGVSRDIYIGENTTLDLGVHPKFPGQNTGEQISWDEASSQPVSRVVRAANDRLKDSGSLQLSAAPHPLDPGWGYVAVVIDGKGEGQIRDVTAVEGDKVRVSPAWKVVPDESSQLALGSFHERAVVYRNRLDGKAMQAQQSSHSASAGIEPFGGVSNLVSDGNTITDCRFGLYAMGEPATPTLFNLYANNFVIGTRYAYTLDARGATALAIGTYAQVFRGNSVASSVEDTGHFSVNALPGNLDMLVFDRNVSTDTAAGYVFKGWGQRSAAIGSLVIVSDYLDRGTAPLAGSYAMNAPTFGGGHAATFRPVLRGSVWTNFANKLAGKWLAGPETPARRLTATARAGGEPVQLNLPVLNGSSSSVRFRIAPPSAAWLSVPQPYLELAPQAEGAVSVACDPRRLRPGKYDTTLYIEGAEPKRAVSIQLSVLP